MEKCMTKECVRDYMDRLGASLAEYMEMPVSARSAEAVDSMTECYTKMQGLYDMLNTSKDPHGDLTEADVIEWNKNMVNADGSHGGHWTIDETTNLGKPDGVSAWEWNLTCNMMYSDYCEVAAKYGVGAARFFADMARAFLNDADAVEDKLAAYYANVVA